MKENVGSTERAVRSLVGPAMIVAGFTRLGGSEGRLLGLATMIAGALTTESAITRVCPTKRALGLDSG